jgi:hypothetical protein
MRRWTLPLFVLLAILHIAPIWSVRYLPLGDGPTHIYNAWVLHELVTGDAPPNITAAYRVDWRPHPNWSGHALMALLIAIVPPLIAEKLLLTLIVALLLAGTWLLATSVDPRNDVYAFLAFPFIWTQSLVAGYYNFSLSIGLYLIIVAIWWRRRERASIGSIALIATLLLVCNFTHPMATLLACGSIVLLSLLTRRFGHLIAIVPVLPLLAMFGRTAESNSGAPLQLSIQWDAARILAKIDTLYSFDDRQRPIAIALALLYLALILYTLVRERRREADAIAILALSLIAMMFWIPAAAGTRELFTGRMQPFVFLILPAWFAPQITDRWRKVLTALLTIIAIANGTIAFERIQHFGRQLEPMVRMFDPIEPETTLLPLFFEDQSTLTYVNGYAHYISYVALEKRLADLSNYEPSTHYFPIAERRPTVSHAIHIAPGTFDLVQPAARADYAITYAAPGDAPNRGSLQFLYGLVKEDGPMRIYRRRTLVIGPHELVLLPLLGTRTNLGAPNGARWRIDQQVHNTGARHVRVLFRDCLNDMPCELVLDPNRSLPIMSDERRSAFLLVPRGTAESLSITTVARRADVSLPETSISIPAIHEREFSRGVARIANIDTRDRKVGLRLYAFGDQAHHEVTLRIRSASDGRIVAERHFLIENFGMYENAELRGELANRAPLPPLTTIEIDAAPDVNLWAFATATDEAGRARVLGSAAP